MTNEQMINSPLTPAEVEAGLDALAQIGENWQVDYNPDGLDGDGCPFAFVFGPSGRGWGRIAMVYAECGGTVEEVAQAFTLLPRALAQLQAQAAEIVDARMANKLCHEYWVTDKKYWDAEIARLTKERDNLESIYGREMSE